MSEGSIQADIKANYHAYLSEIKDDLDPILKQLRKKDELSEKWRGKAFFGPITQFFSAAGKLKFLAKAGSWPFVSSAITSIGLYVANVPKWLLYSGAGGALLIAIVITYMVFVSKYVSKMTRLGSPEFHLGAFKEKKPADFKLWSTLLNRDDFTFNGLYDYIGSVFSQDREHAESVEAVTNYFRGITEQQRNDYRETAERYELKIAEYHNVVGILDEDIERLETAIEYLVSLIKNVNVCLYRQSNEVLTLGDLDFFAGFTLYEQRERLLVKIADKGTTGSSPQTLNLDDEDLNDYAAVVVAKNNLDAPYYNNPYPGRSVVAYRMRIGTKVWVWNFHFDDSDEKALSMTLSSDIIEINEIYRLFHALCLMIDRDREFRTEAPHVNRSENIQG